MRGSRASRTATRTPSDSVCRPVSATARAARAGCLGLKGQIGLSLGSGEPGRSNETIFQWRHNRHETKICSNGRPIKKIVAGTCGSLSSDDQRCKHHDLCITIYALGVFMLFALAIGFLATPV
jgi:hypothetical protein